MEVSPILNPFMNSKIIRARKGTSSYSTSSLMMDYIIHKINTSLVSNFHFRRACPSYHPYILRLYYAVLFWIQCMRASHHAIKLNSHAHMALTYFLDAFPPESLPISSPLLGLFKTLCCSNPEIPNYGYLYPKIPSHPGPQKRHAFMRHEPQSHIMPNIPGIFALLEDLNAKMNPVDDSVQPVYPALGKHIPVSMAAEDTVFGHHIFPAPAQRSNEDKWALVSSGLQYPCEADKKLHQYFAERYNDFDFPTLADDDDLSYYANFLHISRGLAWFANVKLIAACEASFFEGSGTLADCEPFGIAANQAVIEYAAPDRAPTPPMYSADSAGLFPFSFRMKTSARSLPELAEIMAAAFQTNVEMPPNHPFLNGFGAGTQQGPFWQIRPEEYSPINETSYLALHNVIRHLMKTEG